MQQDSIRENLTKEDIITAIKLEMDATGGEPLGFVLVEGQDDVEFVKNIFAENVICYESFSGKCGLEELLQDDDLKYDEIIAIRDKDYMDTALVPRRMFLYDGCCMETMLLSCEEVVSSFYHFYYGGEAPQKEYIACMMRELAPYSILRQKNEKNKWGINFQKIGFGDLIDRNGKLDIKTLFTRIKVGEVELQDCIERAEKVKEEYLKEITNGHDICLMMGVLPKAGRKKLGEDGVRRILLSGYRKSDFQKTKLYKNLRLYQATCHAKFVDE